MEKIEFVRNIFIQYIFFSKNKPKYAKQNEKISLCIKVKSLGLAEENVSTI